MRRLNVGTAVCVALVTAALSGSQLEAAGKWETNFEAAQQKAKDAGKTLVIHFYADWCGPCRNMERDVLNAPEVSAALEDRVVGVKVNSDLRKDLVGRFGVTSLPTDIILSPTGATLSRSVGSPGRSGYLARLMQFSTPAAETAVAAVDTTPSTDTRPSSSEEGNETVVVTVSASSETVPVAPTQPEATAASTESKNVVVQTDDKKDAGDEQPAAESKPTVLTDIIRRDAEQRIGLNGFCPVALTSGSQWKNGSEEFALDFQGVRYLMSSAETLEQFKAAPEKFVPAMHGFDAVAFTTDYQIVVGRMELGATYESRVYFFSTEQNREKFLRSPKDYSRPHDITFFRTAQLDAVSQ